MRAIVLIRSQPVYRRDAFCAGLKACGYAVRDSVPIDVRADDVLVIWNRYFDRDVTASAFEARGGTVLVAENGYLDPGRHGTRSWYALAIGGHNGQGTWRPGGSERWAAIREQLGVELQPWRVSGEYVLVCPNRAFGRPGFVMPQDWAEKTAHELRASQPFPVHLRPHPGNNAPAVPLAQDLDGARRVVIWSSSAGVHALLAGIAVECRAPAWILKGYEADRQRGLERLAWAQWHVEEIASGVPFRHLLSAAGQGEVATAA